MLLKELPKRNEICFHCHQKLSKTESCHSTLHYKASLHERKDYCAQCWKLSEIKQKSEQAACRWKMQAVKALPETFKVSLENNDERALYLLQHALLDPIEQYIIALSLLRKKILRFLEEITLENSLFERFQIMNTDQTLALMKVSLSNIDFEKVRRSISEKLHTK